MREPVRWYDDGTEHPPWIKALAEVRHLATREGLVLSACPIHHRRD